MVDRKIAIGIDGTGAEAGAAVVKRSLDQVGQEAVKTEGVVNRVDNALKGIGGAANDNLKQVQGNVGRLTQMFNELANGTGIASVALRQLGVIIATVAISMGSFLGAALAIRQFISATVDAQRGQAQLAAVLKSTQGASGQTMDTLNALSSSLQALTAYEDDTIGKSEALLLTFTKVGGETFPRAQKAILDMAQAMGGDLQGATLQVGKALNDPIQGIAALSRVGVQFSDAQKQIITGFVNSNQLAKAQAVILRELETEFGGSAEAARHTLGGALQSLGNAWGNLFELLPAQTEGFRAAIERLILALNDPGFQNFMSTVGVGIMGVLEGVTIAATGAVKVISSISNTIGNNWDTIIVSLGAIATEMAIAFGPAALVMVLRLSGAIAVTLVEAIAAASKAMVAFAFSNPFTAIAEGVIIAVTAAYYFRDEIKKALGIDVVEVAKAAGNTIINSFEAAGSDISFMFHNAGLAAEAALTGIKNGAIEAGNFLINGFSAAYSVIKTTFQMLPTALGAAMIGTVNIVIEKVNDMVNAVKMGVNSVINAINTSLGTTIALLHQGTTIQPLDNPFLEDLKNAVDNQTETIKKIMENDPLGNPTKNSALEDLIKRNEEHKKEIERIMGQDPLGDLGKKLSPGSTPGQPPAIPGDQTKKQADEVSDALAAIFKSAKDANLEQQTLVDTLKLTGYQAAVYAQQMDLINKATEQNIALTPAQRQQLLQLGEQMAQLKSQAAALQTIQSQQSDLGRLQLEHNLIGTNIQDKNRELAVYDAEQEMIQKGIDLNGAYAQKIRDNAAAISDLKLANERAEAAMQQWQQTGGNIVDALVNGATTVGTSWKDTFKNIATQAVQFFTQLTVANPIKNALFGTNLPTLTDLFSGKTPLTGATTSTATMTVTAGVVNVAGGVPGLPGATLPGLGATATVPGAAAATAPVNGATATVNLANAAALAPVSGTPAGLTANEQLVWNHFAAQGLPSYQIAGIMGNLKAESGVNFNGPAGDNGAAIGLAQWNSRAPALQAAVPDWRTNPQGQLGFMDHEFATSENSSWTALRNSTNTTQATNAMLGYERPQGYSSIDPTGSSHYTDRLNYANDYAARAAQTPGLQTQNIQQANQNLSTLSNTTKAASDNVSTMSTSVTDTSKALTQGNDSLLGSISKTTSAAQAAPSPVAQTPAAPVAPGATAAGTDPISGIFGAIGGLVKGIGGILSQVLSSITSVIGKIIGGIGNGLGSLFGGIGNLFGGPVAAGGLGIGGAAFALGGVFNQGRVTAFANGGLVSAPTMFPMANGMGLMGERGPEAVIPLMRGQNGRLGISAYGGGGQSQGGSVQHHVVFESHITVSGNGDKDLLDKVHTATDAQIKNWGDTFSREVLPARVRDISNDKWGRGGS